MRASLASDIAVEYSTTVAFPTTTTETFTPDEVRTLSPYFTNTDRPVFALTNLPETVKGALFARYSRSAKSLRRLFLDEFVGHVGGSEAGGSGVGRVLSDPATRGDSGVGRVLSDPASRSDSDEDVGRVLSD